MMDRANRADSFVLPSEDIRHSLLMSGNSFQRLFGFNDIEFGYYALAGTDPQPSHDRDEIYMIAEGRGIFVHGDVRSPFAPGDIIYVPAGETHRFEDFGDRFGAWVVYFQPLSDETSQVELAQFALAVRAA